MVGNTRLKIGGKEKANLNLHDGSLSFESFCHSARRRKIIETVMKAETVKLSNEANRKMMLMYKQYLKQLKNEVNIEEVELPDENTKSKWVWGEGVTVT